MCLDNSVEETPDKTRITKKTGYYWQKEWNQTGYTIPIPEFKGGKKHKLTDLKRLVKLV